MSSPQEAFLRLPGRPVRELLEDLAKIQERQLDGEDVQIPRVTLHMPAGRDVSGWIVRLIHDEDGEALLLQRSSTQMSQPSLDAFYVDPRLVEAITVHDMASALAEPSARTRLGTEKRADTLAKRLAQTLGQPLRFEIQWTSEKPAETELRTLSELVVDAHAALRRLAETSDGREALKTISVIRVVQGETGVRREGNALLFSVRGRSQDRASWLAKVKALF